MPTKDEVLRFIADFKGIPMDQLFDDTALGLSSLSLIRLSVAFERRFGVELPIGGSTSWTVKDVVAVVHDPPFQHSSSASSIHPAKSSRDGTGEPVRLAIGIDIEHVQTFRTARDPRSDPFFQRIFTPAEFGYCLIQPDPAPHFAARFCAKEALRKCDPQFLALPMDQVQIKNRLDGSPYYEILKPDLELDDVTLSLSHTDDFAIAVAARR